MSTVLQKARVILGLILLVVGVAGTLLPIIPGVPIILAGVALIGSDHPLAQSFRARIRRWRQRWKS